MVAKQGWVWLIFLALGLAVFCVEETRGDEAARRTEPLRPADQRFAAADTRETPSFQRHVLPLLGRLGCNGRSCHGSFQGQGGFRLSLFGYDFKADLDALGQGGRASVDDPEGSLILLKPTLAVSHKGGKR